MGHIYGMAHNTLPGTMFDGQIVDRNKRKKNKAADWDKYGCRMNKKTSGKWVKNYCLLTAYILLFYCCLNVKTSRFLHLSSPYKNNEWKHKIFHPHSQITLIIKVVKEVQVKRDPIGKILEGSISTSGLKKTTSKKYKSSYNPLIFLIPH